MKKNRLLFCLKLFSTITAGNYSNYNYASNPPIIVSTICGDLSRVKKECTPTTINTQNRQGQTALMHSCIHGSGDIFTFLMENNADFKIKDNFGKTALDYAIEDNRPEMIEFLLLSGANDTLSLDKALQKAAEFENIKKQTQNMFKELNKALPNIDIIKSCIDAGANVNARDNYGRTALIYAVLNGHIEIAKLLIDDGADVNTKYYNNIFIDDYYTGLMSATRCGHTEIAKLLIAAGADVNACDNYGYTALMNALNGHIEIAKLLINAGADINASDYRGQTALIAAVYNWQTEIAKLLINAGADINASDCRGRTALIAAAYNGQTEIARLLISANADIKIKDNFGKTALDYAIEHNRSDMIEFLLLSGADDNLSLEEALKKTAEFENINKQTQILFKNDINIIKSCIDTGADVNARDEGGWSALMNAAFHGRTAIAKLLIDAGADVNARDNEGYTALISAAKHGHTETAKLLIDAGADVDAKYYDGRYDAEFTPLIYALHRGLTEIVKLLIVNGADVNATGNFGFEALMYAEDNGHTEIVELLKSYNNPIKRFKYKNANLIKALAIGTVVGVAYKLWQNFAK